MRKQEPPFSIQIEFCEGCNLRCSFCGLNGIREAGHHDYKYMEFNTLATLCQEIKRNRWESRLEIAMHGEPTMHPEYKDLVALIRRTLPNHSIMMTSNGGGLLRGNVCNNVIDLFDVGLNCLALDDYDDIKIVSKIRPWLQSLQVDYDITSWMYPEEPEGNPHRRFPAKTKMISVMADISQTEIGTHSTLVNHCGAAAPLNTSSAGKRCHRPFREIAVRWNGEVAVCCNDWRGVLGCGNVVTDGLEAVWNGPVMQSARAYLYQGRREFAPCYGCDATSYRVGLLPDPRGQVTLAPPTEQDTAILEAAAKKPPLTAPVLRAWEKNAGN